MGTLRVDMSRKEVLAFLRERDGDACKFPGCVKPLGDSKDIDTIDHIRPQYICKQEGWTIEQTNDLTNLQIMHRTCNARKGHVPYDADGNLAIPPKEPKVMRVERPDLCDLCYNGRLLFPGELCETCGGTAQPATMPKVLQRTPKTCDHAKFICWACGPLAIIPRKEAFRVVIEGPE